MNNKALFSGTKYAHVAKNMAKSVRRCKIKSYANTITSQMTGYDYYFAVYIATVAAYRNAGRA